MGNLFIKRSLKPRYTYEEMQEIARIELERLKNISDEEYDKDIDYSDIPPLTDEELAKFKPARLRQKKSQNVAS
ncbi:MAG: hypothetical protein II857_05135 [Selenomonadaceae bacterium]|nr:hypothetical protein [Selenomonadaceae bacterium]